MENAKSKKSSEPARKSSGIRFEALLEVSGEAQRHEIPVDDTHIIGGTGCLQATTHHVTDRR